jgi:hypothetical protein
VKKIANAVAPVVQSLLAPVVNQITAIVGDAASCITHPRLGTCLSAAAAVLPFLIGGGEAAALTDTTDIAEEGAADSAADTASPWAGKAVLTSNGGLIVSRGSEDILPPGSTSPAPEGSELLEGEPPSTATGVMAEYQTDISDAATTYSTSIHYDTRGYVPAAPDHLSGAIMTGAMLVAAVLEKLSGRL